MTYPQAPQDEDEERVNKWWNSLSTEQREAYKRLSPVALARLHSRLADDRRRSESSGCFFPFIVGAIFATLITFLAFRFYDDCTLILYGRCLPGDILP